MWLPRALRKDRIATQHLARNAKDISSKRLTKAYSFDKKAEKVTNDIREEIVINHISERFQQALRGQQ